MSVITPYFLKPTQAELIEHFRRVADATTKDVVLYNNPATCAGLSIEPDTVAKLAEIRNIIWFEPANAVKVVMPRRIVSGAPGDSDVYGAQQHAPLLGMTFDL